MLKDAICWIFGASMLIGMAFTIMFCETRQAGAPERAEIQDPLLEAICGTETNAHGFPTWAVNEYGTAWGPCQIKYWSAVYFGGFDDWARLTGIPSRNPADLFSYEVNIRTAGKILNLCRTVHYRATNRILAYCYYAGPNSKPYTDRAGGIYSKIVAVRAAGNQRGVAFSNQ